MPLLTLSLGSNQRAEYHLRQALDGLTEHFGELRLSSVFESRAVGFQGGNFLNMVVAVDTDEPLEQIAAWLKALEAANGRQHTEKKFSSRTLDVDILTWGSVCGRYAGILLPRSEITENAYVLWPLSEVCSECVDPHSGQTYARLWAAYDKNRQSLWPIDFEWRGQKISSAVVYGMAH